MVTKIIVWHVQRADGIDAEKAVAVYTPDTPTPPRLIDQLERLVDELRQVYDLTQHQFDDAWNRPNADWRLRPLTGDMYARSSMPGDIFEVYDGPLSSRRYLVASRGVFQELVELERKEIWLEVDA